MTTKTAHGAHARGERGSAIIGVLLLLLMMSALAAALSVSGHTETLVARNHQSHAQAMVAAEAGLNHAAQVIIDHIKLLDPDAVEAELDALLADPTLLEPDITFDTDIPLSASLEAVSYEASLMDEDDPDRGDATTSLDEDGDASNDEDGIATTDNNLTLVVRSTGHGPNNTAVTIEGILAPYEYGALVTDGNLGISGSVDIDGADGNGSVHSNGNLTISGGGSNITGDITASGTYSGSAAGISGAPNVPIPEVDPADYRHHADFILTSTGKMTNQAGGTLCTWSAKTSCNSWDWSSSSQTWTLKSNSATNGTYYVEGHAKISGSPGNAAKGTPWALTLIAERSIDISGSPDLTADTNELLFVAGGDLEISGGLDTGDPLTTQGQVLVHEQIKLSGNPAISGQVIVEDAENVETLVSANAISGNVSITYNGGLGSNLFTITGWSEVK